MTLNQSETWATTLTHRLVRLAAAKNKKKGMGR
jgi:hypothetical protein